ncbi:hypothetical protein [Luteimicrobium subarcticum]|uniref:Uncharacterized protein n=1 Tax=Luteimicrobium subarcticum TaxID=620910 RepID=A0A2M8WRV4_9MICO|nr:hypothetical protein [Luteimicrobium subarcticum]PJI93667.1 hypothetical protein CLV34_1141 [Luteimicrobium subarcticum]
MSENTISEALDAAGSHDLDGAARDTGPSNQDIIDHAKSAYQTFRATVDASAQALAAVVTGGQLTAAITALDDADWQGTVDPELVTPVLEAPAVAKARADADKRLGTYSVGVFSNDLRDGGVGVVGFARATDGEGLAQVTLVLDIVKHAVTTEPGRNLQLGQWVKAPDALHDEVYGLYIQSSVGGIQLDVKIVLDTDLEPYGFVESTGASLRLPAKAYPFSGSTSVG